MASLADADLYPIANSPRVHNLIHRLHKNELLAVIKEWFKHPDLQPRGTSSTWEDYNVLADAHKSKVVERLLRDWPNGLCMLQVAQLDLRYFINHPKIRSWKIWELKEDENDPGKLQKMLDTRAAATRIYDHLSHYFKCHVATVPNNDTDWLRITFFETRHTTELPIYSQTAHMIRYPHTQFFLLGGTPRKDLKNFLIQAVVHAYSASKIKEQNLNSRNVTQLKSMMVNQKSQGFLVDFRLNQVDNHPLDFVSSKKRRGSRDADYVKTREQRRRIVPLDRTLIQGRYQQARDTFGNNVAQGVESLSIELHQSFKEVIEANNIRANTDEPIRVGIHFQGNNVMEGLRQLMLKGIIEPPVKDWMIDLATQAVTKVYVTKDGVLREEEEEEEEKEENEENQPVHIQ